jgi:hypothetical protein
MMTQMTANNVGALLVIKAGEKKALAGIITERGGACILVLNPLKKSKSLCRGSCAYYCCAVLYMQ